MVALNQIKRVGVIDDDEAQAEAVGELLSDLGFEPVIITGRYETAVQLADDAVDRADAIVCDHRLSEYGMAKFYGAEAVAEFFQRGKPSVLLTQYRTTDSNVSIRRWREWIPSVLSRQDTAQSVSPVIHGFERCIRELSGQPPADRKPYRSMVEIVGIGEESEPIADVLISNWRPLEAVRIPVSVIPEDLRRGLRVGTFLIARVNVGATSPEDLFFADFELAPDPVEI